MTCSQVSSYLRARLLLRRGRPLSLPTSNGNCSKTRQSFSAPWQFAPTRAFPSLCEPLRVSTPIYEYELSLQRLKSNDAPSNSQSSLRQSTILTMSQSKSNSSVRLESRSMLPITPDGSRSNFPQLPMANGSSRRVILSSGTIGTYRHSTAVIGPELTFSNVTVRWWRRECRPADSFTKLYNLRRCSLGSFRYSDTFQNP
jgi:hypothetical protein